MSTNDLRDLAVQPAVGNLLMLQCMTVAMMASGAGFTRFGGFRGSLR